MMSATSPAAASTTDAAHPVTEAALTLSAEIAKSDMTELMPGWRR